MIKKEKIEFLKRNKVSLIISIIILILLLLFGLKSCNEKSNLIKLGGEDPIEKVTEISTNNEMINFPRLQGTYRIDENNQHLTLTNSEKNDVYMKFIYKLDDKILCTSDYIEPAKSYNANMYELLEQGNYSIHIEMQTLDIATHEQCTSMTARADVIITK